MVRCGLCHSKVGNGAKYRKHLMSLRHASNQAKKMDPEWVDIHAANVPRRKLDALGLGKNRWISAQQHQVVLSLKRIAGTGIEADCFALTGCQTRLGFCTE